MDYIGLLLMKIGRLTQFSETKYIDKIFSSFVLLQAKSSSLLFIQVSVCTVKLVTTVRFHIFLM